jgi:hypothetical protein
MPAYIEPVTNSPESSRVNSGASVKKYTDQTTPKVIDNASQSILRNSGATGGCVTW